MLVSVSFGWLVRQHDCTKTTELISTKLKRRIRPRVDPIIQISLDPEKGTVPGNFFLTFCQGFTPTHRHCADSEGTKSDRRFSLEDLGF